MRNPEEQYSYLFRPLYWRFGGEVHRAGHGSSFTLNHMPIYDPGSAVPPPLPPPMVPPHPPPLWCGVVVGCFPPPPVVWCGVVVGCFPPPCGVVWFGCGLWWFPPFPPCGVVWVGWFPPACLDLLTHAHDDFDDDDDDDNHDHHYHNHLSVSLVVGYLLPTCLLTIIALLTVGARSL